MKYTINAVLVGMITYVILGVFLESPVYKKEEQLKPKPNINKITYNLNSFKPNVWFKYTSASEVYKIQGPPNALYYEDIPHGGQYMIWEYKRNKDLIDQIYFVQTEPSKEWFVNGYFNYNKSLKVK